jgi:TolB-like protein
MSSDPEQEFFSDGISEEILNALAKVKDLKVAGRTSSFAFKGKNQDLRLIGETLGVNHILEGSVRKSGNQVRITAQLIQVEDGFHLWSETYDRELTNVFAIQDEIAAAILEQMKAELLAGESEAMLATQTDSQAYELYLLAKQRIYERTRASIEAAATMLDSALEIDPEYVPALAQRAIATMLLSVRNYGTLIPEESDRLAKGFADRAIALNPDSVEALSALGLYHSNRPTEGQEAVEYLEKALTINPGLLNANNWLQQAYQTIGELDKSLAINEAMVERDPLYPPGVSNLVIAYLNRARIEDASELIEKMEVFMPGDASLIAMRGAVASSYGRYAEDENLMEQAIQLEPENGSFKFGLAFTLLATQQYEKLLRDFMPPFMRIRSLHAVGKTEEATISAYERAGIGDIDPLFQLMNREGRYQDLVSFFEERWPDLASFQVEYPGGQRGYGQMLDLALAFSKTDNQERFDQAMTYVRSHHDRLIEQGMKIDIMYFREASYYALLNDHSRAMDQLETAINMFGVSSARIAWEYPALLPLESDERYQALQQKMLDHINSERAKLGLEPVSI